MIAMMLSRYGQALPTMLLYHNLHTTHSTHHTMRCAAHYIPFWEPRPRPYLRARFTRLAGTPQSFPLCLPAYEPRLESQPRIDSVQSKTLLPATHGSIAHNDLYPRIASQSRN